MIESCREQAAGKTVEFTGSWLPPALAADLSSHAAPDPGPARDTGLVPAPDRDPVTTPGPGRRLSGRTVIAVAAVAAIIVALAGYGVATLASGAAASAPPPTVARPAWPAPGTPDRRPGPARRRARRPAWTRACSAPGRRRSRKIPPASPSTA